MEDARGASISTASGVIITAMSALSADAGGLDLIGKAAVLKTAGRKPFRVRIPGPPLVAVQWFAVIGGEGDGWGENWFDHRFDHRRFV